MTLTVKDAAGATQTVSTVDEALAAAGLSTGAKQDTGNTALANLLTELNDKLDQLAAQSTWSATGNGAVLFGVRKDTATDLASADGKIGPPQLDSSGAMRVNPSALSSANDSVTAVGSVAHDGVDSGNPVKIGGKARTTNPTAVSDGDRVDAMYDKLGRQVVILGQPRDLRAQQATTITSSTAETTILTAGATGVLHDLTTLLITNSSATDVTVAIKDATAGTTIMTIGVKAGTTAGFAAPQAVPQTTAANNWTATVSASVASVLIYVQANKVV